MIINAVFLIFYAINILYRTCKYIYINRLYEIPHNSFKNNSFQQQLIKLICSYYHTIYLTLSVPFTDWQFKSG